MGKPTKSKAEETQIQDTDMDWGGEVVTGFESTRPEDLGIPFLTILQDGSAEVKKTHKDYPTKGIEGAEAGMIINSMSREIVYQLDGEPLKFVPCSHEKLFVEWRPKSKGGGVVKMHQTAEILSQCKRNDKKEDELSNGNIIKTTSYFSGLAFIGDEWVRTILSLSSTQLKKGRGWLNTMTAKRNEGRPMPMFSHIYLLSTVAESNPEGSWFGWKIEEERVLRRSDMPLIDQARGVAEQVTKGRLALPAPPEGGTDEEKPY